MKFAGSASWRFAEGIEEMPVVALFARDVAGLDMPADDRLPPRLDDHLSGGSTHLDTERRAAAATDWIAWWQAIVAHEVHSNQGVADGGDQQPWMRQMATERASIFDPPDFASLGDRPILREAVRTNFADALRWCNTQRRSLLLPPTGRPGQFDYDLVRAVVEQVADHHKVSPGAVRGHAVVLPVEGIWWNRFAPGAVLCSVHAARDPATARRVLTDAFESGLLS